MTTSRIYAYRWPARLVSHKPFAAERYFITSSCIWQVFFRDFSEKIRFFFFIFFFWPPGSNFVQNAQFPEAPSGGKPEPPFQDAPKKLLLYKNPLRHRCTMPLSRRSRFGKRTSQSASQTAPLTGEPLAGRASPAVRLGSIGRKAAGLALIGSDCETTLYQRVLGKQS